MNRMTDSGLLPQVDVEDEELQSVVAGQVRKLEQVLAALQERVREIENDSGLNREGRRDRKKELAAEFAPKLKSALNLPELERLDSRVQTLEERLFESGPHVEVDLDNEDLVRRQARETREILRRRFADTDDPEARQELLDVIRDAVENNEVATLIALRDAPPAFPVLDGEDLPDLDAIRRRHAETHFPEQVQGTRDRRSTVSIAHHNVERARERFRELTGSDPVDTPRFHVVENGSLEPLDTDVFGDEGADQEGDTAEGEGKTEPADEPAGEGAEPVTA